MRNKGAGPAGISTAYTLSQLGNLPIPIKITVFEQNDRIGGRLVLSSSSTKSLQVKLHAEDLATGVLLAGNGILSQRAEKILGLKKVSEDSGEAVKVGLWDGEGMRSVQTRPINKKSWKDWFEDVKRYGVVVLWNARKLPVGTMRGWREVLSFKNKKIAEIGAVNFGAGARLKKNGVTGRYVAEIVETVLQRHFGQSVEEVSDLTLSMGLEREFSTPSSSSSTGGKYETILQSFLDRSGAEIHLNTRIISLQKSAQEDDSEVEWTLSTLSRAQEQTSHTFDKIILAGPWNTSSLLNNTQNDKVEQVFYRALHQTLITSFEKINASYFHTTEEHLPEQILPIPSSDLLPLEMSGIHSISFLRPVFGPDAQAKSDNDGVEVEAVRYLYSISSSQPLPRTTIELLWGEGEVDAWMTEEIECAYPLLYPRSFEGEEMVDGMELDGEGLWHTGFAEGIASEVDWSWVVGEKVAGRIEKRLRGVDF